MNSWQKPDRMDWALDMALMLHTGDRTAGWETILSSMADNMDILSRSSLSLTKKRKGVAPAIAITIRPAPETMPPPAEFMSLVLSIMSKQVFTHAVASLEQVGDIDTGDLGRGMHAHIVGLLAPKRCKSHVVSALNIRAVSDIAEGRGVHVVESFSPVAFVKRYLMNYEADDEHKIVHKAADALWRTQHNIPALLGDWESFQGAYQGADA